jgi:hypothetical protein
LELGFNLKPVYMKFAAKWHQPECFLWYLLSSPVSIIPPVILIYPTLSDINSDGAVNQ